MDGKRMKGILLLNFQTSPENRVCCSKLVITFANLDRFEKQIQVRIEGEGADGEKDEGSIIQAMEEEGMRCACRRRCCAATGQGECENREERIVLYQ
jgi:hypothetical protein